MQVDDKGNDRDPWSGPLAGVTGRLSKLNDHLDGLKGPELPAKERLDGILFELGMLTDLMTELAWKVSDLLPPTDEDEDLAPG